MAESATTRTATLAGGISRLKAEVRSPGQVASASNADFMLQSGMEHRAGTSHVFALGSSIASSVWLDSKTIQGGDRVISLVGSDGTVRVFGSSSEAYAQIDPIAATYLAVSGTTRSVSSSVDDGKGVVRIANSGVTPLATSSPSVTSSGQRNTYSALESFTPSAPGQVWKANESSDNRPAGLYRYIPGIGTFATAQFGAYVSGTANGETVNLCAAGQNPRGFKLFYSRFVCDSTVAVYSTTTSASGTVGIISGGLTLTGYVFQPGDYIYYSGGGGGTPGAYPIASYSGGIMFLDGVITGAAAGNVSIRGIGKLVTITENFYTSPVNSMDDAAVRYTNALRSAGLINACVQWDWTSLAAWTGKFTITAGDGGPMSGFPSASYVVFAPTASGVVDDTAAGKAFQLSPTVTAGTGAYESFTTVPRARWYPVPVPDQTDAVLDTSTMPVRLRKVSTASYAGTATDLGAWHYWGLGDSSTASNVTAADASKHSLGTYFNSPTRGVTGLVSGSSTTATTFDGTNDYVGITTWWAIGNRSAISVEMLVQTTNAAVGEKCLFHMKQANDLYVTMNKTAANRITVYAGGGESYCNVTNFNSGATKHLVVVCTSGTIAVYVNGTAQTMTVVSSVTGNPGIGSEQGGYTINIGRRIDASMYFSGTLDEVAVYPFSLSQSAITYRYAQSTNSASGDLWTIEQGVYASRITGDSTTNPVPSFVKNAQGISAMTVWQGRDGFGAGRSITLGRANEGTSFFVNDVTTVTDADPIDRVVAQEGNIVALTPFGSICVATTDGPVQYELSAAQALTISSLNSRAGYRQNVASTRPVLSGDRLYIAAPTSQGSTYTGTLLEATIDEQSVAGLYDDIGQGIPGLINPSSLNSCILASIASVGKVVLCEIGGSRIWVYQTAYVGQEKRQSAWSEWTLSGATIKAACDEGESVLLLVSRSGKYLIERWKPEPADLWPTSAQRLDGRVSVTGGSYSAGVTTFTMPTDVPATGIDKVVKSDGTIYTATPTSATQFTVAANLSGVTVTAGRSYTTTARLSRPFQRDVNGQAYIGQNITLSHTILTATDLTRVTATVTVDSRAGTTWPVRSINNDSKLGRAWTRGPAERTTVDITLSGAQPISVGTCEIISDAVGGRT